MIPPFNAVEFGIVVAMFAIVTVLGFLAVHWQRAPSLHSIDEWGLGGRRFGAVLALLVAITGIKSAP